MEYISGPGIQETSTTTQQTHMKQLHTGRFIFHV